MAPKAVAAVTQTLKEMAFSIDLDSFLLSPSNAWTAEDEIDFTSAFSLEADLYCSSAALPSGPLRTCTSGAGFQSIAALDAAPPLGGSPTMLHSPLICIEKAQETWMLLASQRGDMGCIEYRCVPAPGPAPNR